MRLVSRTFEVPKAGLSKVYYEDAYEPHALEAEGENFRLAIADGATESAFSGPWARQLVRALRRSGSDVERFAKLLPQLQEKWLRFATRKPLAWYAEQRVRRGAFAAIAALELSDSPQQGDSGIWRALALGDSCLFQVRGTHVIVRFPLSEAAAFTNQPLLLSSNSSANTRSLQAICTTRGDWYHHDQFYLMTDALACWFLTAIDADDVPWPALSRFGTALEKVTFPDFVEQLRSDRAIRNDDCTLMRIEVFGSSV